MCGLEIRDAFSLEPHCHATEGAAGRSLGLEDHELPAGALHNLTIKLHHAITRLQVSSAPEWAASMDLGDDGIRADALYRDLLLRREGFLPQQAQFLDRRCGADALGSDRELG